jgi:hypothetical protein
MVDLETIKTALKKLNYPIPAELTNMLRDQMIDIETFETLWKRLSPPTVEEVCSVPTFSGLDHEDPKKFITECKNILANSNPAYSPFRISNMTSGGGKSNHRKLSQMAN